MQGEGVHWDIAKHLIASAQKVMPEVPIFQLTDASTPCHDGATAIRCGGLMPMAVRRMTLHAGRSGDWLFVDTDIVFQKDVRHVFEDDFEIAVADRVGSAWEHTPYGQAMPFNMGVTFSRSAEFWERAREALLMLPAKFQEWEGDQRVVCEMQRLGWIKTKILPGHVYNFTPMTQDEDVSHAAILHLKGKRKHFAEFYANHLGRPGPDHSGSGRQLENGTGDRE